MMKLYLFMDDKEQITDVNNIDNWPAEYTLDDTGPVTGKIRSHEDSIRLLKVPTQIMARRSAQKVNNLIADVCMDWDKGTEHWPKQYMELTKRVHNHWYMSWNGKIWSQKNSIRLLKGPTQTMARRSAQIVKNMPVDVCMDWGKGAEHLRKKCSK